METNQAIADIFDHMAELYQLGGEEVDRYRIVAYQGIAQTLRAYQGDITDVVKDDNICDIPGVGQAIESKIREYIQTGKIQAYEKLKARFPKTLISLLDIPSLGPKKVHVLWKELKVESKRDLRKVLKNGSVANLPGFGKKTVENIFDGLDMVKAMKKRRAFAEMIPVDKSMKQYLKRSKLVTRLDTAGSFRRQEETIGDLDYLAVSKKPLELIHYLVKHPKVWKILAEGETKGSIVLEGGQQVDLRVVKPDEWGAALQYFTGSKEHNIQLRKLARQKNLIINEYGVFELDERHVKSRRIAGKTEKEVYKSLGLKYIPPEKRKGITEIEDAVI